VARRCSAPFPPERKKPIPSVSRPLAPRSARGQGLSFYDYPPTALARAEKAVGRKQKAVSGEGEVMQSFAFRKLCGFPDYPRPLG
jgi:hypothetical protein